MEDEGVRIIFVGRTRERQAASGRSDVTAWKLAVGLARITDCGERKGGKQDGDGAAGFAVWSTDAGEGAGICGDCDFDAGAGDWGEHGVVFCGERCAAESAGLSAVRAAR